jgi:hypothetical protein
MYCDTDKEINHIPREERVHLLVQMQWKFIIVNALLREVRSYKSLTMNLYLAYVIYGNNI